MPKKKKATPKSDFFTNIIILARVNTIKFNSYSLFCTQFEIVDINPHFYSIIEQGLPKPKQLTLHSVGKKDPYARILIRKLS